MDPILSVRNLTVEFDTPDGIVHAVSDLNYDLFAGETLAILGESGSGKSVSVQALMGLLPQPPARIVSGSVDFEGQDLLANNGKAQKGVRGKDISMIFQDPLTSLNPVYRVGWQIAEMARIHNGSSRSEAKDMAVSLMTQVGIPDAASRARQYPHEFSGGMRQRIMIAMALALKPKVLIADEPTTALDVTIQAQIMELLAQVQADTGMGLILITHDLGVVASAADRVLVMYAGRMVETGPAHSFYASPQHPYSQGLLTSVPRLLRDTQRLVPIMGQPPSLTKVPQGCAFHPRCPHRIDACSEQVPAAAAISQDTANTGSDTPTVPRSAACIRLGEF